MKIIFFRKSLALFSAATLITCGIVLACSDYFLEYDYSSSFAPESYVDETYSPLFYSPEEPFYRINYDTEHIGRFNGSITSDWETFLSGKMKVEDITYLLLNDAPEIEILFRAVQNKSKAEGRFAALNLTDDKVKGFINFLHFAKAVEVASTREPYSWNYEEKQEIPVVEQKLIDELNKLYTVAKDPFLKNRLWFQALKANFYGPNRKGVIDFFERTKATAPENTLYYRGLAYVAGAYYGDQNYAQANYLYSIVFDKCEALMTVATYSFHPQEQSDFNASLNLAKTPDQKAALWALLGYYGDEFEAIKQIYKVAPSSHHLDFLLTRLVNKKESSLNGEAFKSIDEYHAAMKKLMKADDLQFIVTVAKENKTHNPALWNCAAGYLQALSGNTAEATQYFDKAEKVKEASALATAQLRVLRLINALLSTTKLDGKAESKLLPELTWLYNDRKDDELFRSQHVISWSQRYLSAMYARQQNPLMAELFNQNSDYYTAANNLASMKAFLSRTDLSAWEKMASGRYAIKLNDIIEYEGITNAYAGKFDEAIALLKQSGDATELRGNPFNGKIKDCNDCDHAAPQKVKYTKVALVQKMKEMSDHIAKGEDVYNNSLLLANAYYNMTYFGNARLFYGNIIIDASDTNVHPRHSHLLLNCTPAKSYYQKAFDAAANDEQRAKCVYMMAKCERNEYYVQQYGTNEATDINFLAWPGFQKLKNDYANTKYYRDVIRECGYFQQYAER